jgi:hypothetical protein
MSKRYLKLLSILIPLFALWAVLPSAAQAPASRAILTRGTLAVRGVEHFPANAISAFYGEYRWGDATVRVWVVRDELYLSGDWTEYPLHSSAGVSFKAFKKGMDGETAGLTVVALRAAGYWAVVEMPISEGNPRAFLAPFSERLQYFFSHAASPSEVSLPAILDIK